MKSSKSKMEENLISAINKRVGTRDGNRLVDCLSKYGVKDDLEINGDYISIPAALIEDTHNFQKELEAVSICDRAYPISVVDSRIKIDVTVYKKVPSHHRVSESNSTYFPVDIHDIASGTYVDKIPLMSETAVQKYDESPNMRDDMTDMSLEMRKSFYKMKNKINEVKTEASSEQNNNEKPGPK